MKFIVREHKYFTGCH